MYVVVGASGNTGSVVANQLLAQGKKVRIIGRNAAHLQPLSAKGADIVLADVSDAAELVQAFQNGESAYVMIPPDPARVDVRDFQGRVTDAIAMAVEKSGIKNVVALSSIGADQISGTGPVVGLYELEQKLNRIQNVNVLSLRAGYFMENALAQIGAIKMMGSAIGPLRPDLKLAMIAARDIGVAAANALLRLEFRGKQTQELHGQRDLDYTEATRIIAQAIAKPDLKYIQGSRDQLRKAMVQMGMSDNFAGLILEMSDALNSGHMKPLEARSARNTTPTSFETFVAESFVPAYQHQQAA
jgi:uncharacterized protein YbjT (DUF2867 family)